MNKAIKEFVISEACGCGMGSHFHQSYMAKPQLKKIAEYASKMYTMIPDDHALEDWMESKIAQMADDIGEVYHKLDYEHDSSEPAVHHEGLNPDGGLDPVGDADADIDNDGDVDDSDAYLHHRRNVISQVVNDTDHLDETELCKRGKEAAKAAYDVYPSAYANGYAVQVCKGQKPDKNDVTKKSKGW